MDTYSGHYGSFNEDLELCTTARATIDLIQLYIVVVWLSGRIGDVDVFINPIHPIENSLKKQKPCTEV